MLLLSRVHGGCLWLDKHYPIDGEVMKKIFGFSKVGNDPIESIYLKDASVEEVYDKYGIHRRKQGVFSSIV